MKTIPFDLAMAKEIHEGKREGEIVTREGNPVEILGFDLDLGVNNIAYLVYDEDDGHKLLKTVPDSGLQDIFTNIEDDFDLLLRVPDDTPSFKPFDKVLRRNSNIKIWTCDLFSHMAFNGEYPYACITGYYKYCIPYEGNEELVGTSNNPKNE